MCPMRMPAPMTRTVVSLLVVVIALVGVSLVGSEPAQAAPEPLKCHAGIDGSSNCDVRAAGCETSFRVAPDGTVTPGPVDC